MSEFNGEYTKFFRIRRTLYEMLRDRGYSVPDDEINMKFEQFVAKLGEGMKRDDFVIHKCKEKDPLDQIYVFFPEEPKVGVKSVTSYSNRMKEDKVYNAIVVVRKGLSPQAKQSISLVNKCFNMDVFEEAQLLVNVTKHVLVPKHELLTKDQKDELLKRFKVTETRLPRILVDDPVAKYYGLKRGQVVKITRKSQTADTYETYRFVV